MEISVHHTGSSGNLFQVDNLLIDPGVPVKKIKEALNYRLSEIEGCLVSHSHFDHCKAANDVMKAGVDCYMSFETAQAINASGHRTTIVEPLRQLEIGEYKIKPFELKHDVPNLGFIISRGAEKLLFATDTAFIPYKVRNLNYIMLSIDFDAEILKENVDTGKVHTSLAKRIFKDHMSLQTALDFFRANDMSRVKEIHILHLSNLNSNPEYFKSEVEKVAGRPVYLSGGEDCE